MVLIEFPSPGFGLAQCKLLGESGELNQQIEVHSLSLK